MEHMTYFKLFQQQGINDYIKDYAEDVHNEKSYHKSSKCREVLERMIPIL